MAHFPTYFSGTMTDRGACFRPKADARQRAFIRLIRLPFRKKMGKRQPSRKSGLLEQLLVKASAA
jgi:hypothetical protein